MEFWGVEVKSGKPCSVELYQPRVVHLSQACLGEGKDKGNEPIYLYVTINGKKIVLGRLYPNKLPQQHFDLMFDKSFELSHSWKNGTVNFFGYECDQPDESDSSDFGSDSEFGEDIPSPLAHEVNGKPAALATKQKLNSVGPEKDIKDGNSSDDFDTASSEDEPDSDEDDSSDTDSSEDEGDEKAEEIPKKVEKVSKKRPAEPASETPGKKAKLVTPKKSGVDNKKANVHVDTPYPSKKAEKTSANQSKQKTPESAESHLCKPCKRPFKSEKALESHSKAKHSGGK